MGNIFSSNNSEELVITNSISNKPIKNLNVRIKKIKIHSDCIGKTQLLLDDNLSVESIDLSSNSFYVESLERLPPKLQILLLNYQYHNKINNFPQNLKELKCTDYFYFEQSNIPNTLLKLTITQSGITAREDFTFEPVSLPENLEELYFCYEEGYQPEPEYLEQLIKLFENLPRSLKVLQIPSFWNIPLINLPLGLKKLYIEIEFNQFLDLLPESIGYIEFVEQWKFDKPVNNLPSQLEHLNLQFQNKYSHTISNLPNSIKFLELGEYELEIGKLPLELVNLQIASPVKFVEFVNMETSVKTQYYTLSQIGKYNITNNINISIPPNLSTITWWDGEVSVYTYKKCSDNNLWYECKDI